jgi:hypothetical protein
VRSHRIEGCAAAGPVQKVVIRIESHDQGWSDDKEHHGTYEHSWTWFDACVIKARDSKSRPGTEAFQNHLRLTTNVHGKSTTKLHRLVWTREGMKDFTGPNDPLSQGGPWHHLLAEDRMRWVRDLEVDDQIVIVPMADFLGWENHVLSIQLDVYSAWLG